MLGWRRQIAPAGRVARPLLFLSSVYLRTTLEQSARTRATRGAKTKPEPTLPQDMQDHIRALGWPEHHARWHYEQRYDFWHHLAG